MECACGCKSFEKYDELDETGDLMAMAECHACGQLYGGHINTQEGSC